MLLQELTLRNIRAVIFDLDDTLYPEKQYIASGFRAVSAQIFGDFGVDCFARMCDLFETDKKDVYGRVLTEYGIKCDKKYVEKLICIYREHTPTQLTFYPDVKEFLKQLKEQGLKIGIITDGRIISQSAKLNALGCYGVFDDIIITDELGGEQYRKPSVAAYELMCNKFGISFSSAAYIADNPAKDFYITTKGMFTVRIKRDDALYSNVEDYYEGVREDILIYDLL